MPARFTLKLEMIGKVKQRSLETIYGIGTGEALVKCDLFQSVSLFLDSE